MRQLPAAIHAMLSGDFTDLGRWAYDYRQAISLSAMAVAMDCASFASAARLERIRRETGSAILGAAIDFPFPAICEGLKLPRKWPLVFPIISISLWRMLGTGFSAIRN
jgi:hypothetical protein